MKKKLLLGCIVFFLFVLSEAYGDQADFKITIIETMSVPVVQNFTQSYVQQLQDHESLNSKSIEIQILNAEGSKEKAMELLVQDFAKRKPDLVISIATLASQAAHELTKDTHIPLLFTVVADPIGAGLVKKIGVPSGNTITGLIHALPRSIQIEFAEKLATQAIPNNVIRIGIVAADYPSSISDIRMLQEAIRGRPFIINQYIIPYRKLPEGLSPMLADAELGIEELHSSVDFWWEVSGPLGEIPEFIALLQERSNKPVLYGNRIETVKNGAVFGMIQNIETTAQEAVTMTDAILKGRDPGTIAIKPPSTFDLAINLKTTLNLGIIIPPEMMILAGKNIYK